MSSPPELPAFCLSDMALRVDDNIQTTLVGIERVLSLVGGTCTSTPYNLTVVCGGIQVQVAAFRVLGADYLEVGSGDRRPPSTSRRPCAPSAAAEPEAMLAQPRLPRRATVSSPKPAPRRPNQRPHKKVPPPPPKSLPADDPLEVPPLSLDAMKVEDAWETVDGIAAWPREELRDFAAAHADVCLLYARGALEPFVFEKHMQKLPPPVRKGLKWFSRKWNILPQNVAVLIDQVSMLCAEGEAFWTLHGC